MRCVYLYILFFTDQNIVLRRNKTAQEGLTLRQRIPMLKRWHVAATAMKSKMPSINLYKPLFLRFPLVRSCRNPGKTGLSTKERVLACLTEKSQGLPCFQHSWIQGLKCYWLGVCLSISGLCCASSELTSLQSRLFQHVIDRIILPKFSLSKQSEMSFFQKLKKKKCVSY